MKGKPKDLVKKHDKCPDCGAKMETAYIRVSGANGKRKPVNKGIKICSAEGCPAAIDYVGRKIYVKSSKFNVAKKLGLQKQKCEVVTLAN